MSIIGKLPFNLQNGQTADATQVMANFDEILNDVNNNAAHNGVNNDITALSALVTPITPAQGGATTWYGTGAGTANAQTVPTPTPAGFALNAGYTIFWVPSVSNTGALTLSVNATTVTAVKVQTESGVQPCIGGEVISGQLAKATYDGTQWVLDMDPMVGFGTGSVIASATTTDLGAAASHFVIITSTTTITSFGASASLARPIYIVEFGGILTLTHNASSLILPGNTSITTAVGDTALCRYFGSGNWIVLGYWKQNGQAVNFNPTFLQNYLSGLTLSTAGSSGTFGIAAGEGVDSTNVSAMLLNSAYTKTTASWAVGSGNGGLDTGSIAGSTWYHAYLIQRPDTGVTDILFSLSATSPTMPTNYTLFRRIGSMKTDGSNHWLAFTQTGDNFIWATMAVDQSNASVASVSRNTQALTVPTGVVVSALFRAAISIAHDTTFILFTSLQETDQAVGSPAAADISSSVAFIGGSGSFSRLTNTSAQIGVRSSIANATGLYISTYGWIDTRGRFG